MNEDINRFNTERSIYLVLKKNGPMTLEEIGKEIKISKMGALKWIRKLENDGLIGRKIKKNQNGRPSFLFEIKKGSQIDSESSGSEKILVDLFAFLKRMGNEDLGKKFLEERYEKIYRENFQNFLQGDISIKIWKLKEMREKDGYMPELKMTPSSDYNLMEYNCPIFKIASMFPEACEMERKMFEKLLNARVESSHRQVDGNYNCHFCISAQDPLHL